MGIIKNSRILIIIFTILSSYVFSEPSKEEKIKKLKEKVDEFNLNNKAIAVQIPANKPCEDKFTLKEIKLPGFEGIFMSVFDGHGGEELSEFGNKKLYSYFIESFNNNKENNIDNKIVQSLKEALKRIEEEFLSLTKNKFKEGIDNLVGVGSCVLIAVVGNNKIYTANLGDSEGKLYYKTNGDNKVQYKSKQLSKIFNARIEEERKKLKQNWPNDESIYESYYGGVYYVKGLLQPTRTLGDFYLKYEEFYRTYFIDKKFEGPYISSEPYIKIFDIKKEYKYVVLASDGLWDDLSQEESNNLFKDNEENNNSSADKLIYEFLYSGLKKSADENNIDFIGMIKMNPGSYLRKIHDDITIIVCDLSKL